MLDPLKYNGYSIVFQEVPDEITLAINISGCPHKCEGCHSSYLWEYNGRLLKYDLGSIIYKYIDYISCVCFMGGDQNQEELLGALKMVKYHKIKTCLYTGVDNITQISILIPELDYVKIGHYSEEHGGLQSLTTNQKMYKKIDGRFVDITSRFWK
ncbi:MAG: 4Fe-4S cluster-binding domain-containing protein [Clostridiales bacterium]|nr:4Fe-4S cluster-binding domain-containing protein [Clostridiales bacterium]